MKGRKPVPKATHEARGTNQPCRERSNVLDFPAAAEVPKPPRWLKGEGKREWERLGVLLLNGKALTAGDWMALGHLCHLHGEIVDCYKRNVPVAAATLGRLQSMCAEFGLTPASRARVPRVGEGEKQNAFSRNGVKAKAKAGGES